MARIQKVPTGTFSPYYGCAIMLAAIFIFGGIVAWSIYSLVTQDKYIAAITVDEPVALPPVTLTPEQKAQLQTRLTAFGDAAKNRQAATLSLTVPEINALITMAPDTGYGTYADMVRIVRTEPAKNTLVAQICLPLNRIKFWEDKKRYLIGEATFQVLIFGEGVDAKVVDVNVPGKEVPEGFITGMEIWTFLAPYRKLEPLGTVLKAATKAQVTPEGVVLATGPQQ